MARREIAELLLIDAVAPYAVYELAQPMIVDQTTLAAEDAKLKKSYTATETFLKKLDTATDRLLANPALAWQLVGG